MQGQVLHCVSSLSTMTTEMKISLNFKQVAKMLKKQKKHTIRQVKGLDVTDRCNVSGAQSVYEVKINR